MARILCVESCPDRAERLCSLLARGGHAVHVVNCAERAMMCIDRQGSYELLVLSLYLPGMDGAELCRWVEQWSSVRGVPKVAFTWGDTHIPVDVSHGLPRWLPVDRFIDGLVRVEALAAAVEEVLANRKPQSHRRQAKEAG